MPARRAPILDAALVAALVAALIPCTACAVPPAPVPPTETERDATLQGADTGAWGDRLLVEAMLLPAVWLERDRPTPSNDTGSYTGPGYGLRGAVGNRDQSIGLLYQGFDVESDRNELQVHSMLFDFDVRAPLLDRTGPLFVRAAAAWGAAWLDATDDDVSYDMAAQLRLGFELAPNDRVSLGTSLGGVVFGHPGDTAAYGAFFELGLTLTF